MQALLCRIKSYTAFTLANITTRTKDPIDDDYLGLLLSSGIVEDCGRIVADVLNAPDEDSEDEQEEQDEHQPRSGL